MRHPDVKGNMEQFMMQHVLPEFASPEPYMRAIVRTSIVVQELLSRLSVS